MAGGAQPKINAGFSQAAIDFEERWGEGDEEEDLSGRDLCGASDSSVAPSLLLVVDGLLLTPRLPAGGT